jgi:hypothetical protein
VAVLEAVRFRSESSAEVDSLSAGQVERLLRALDQHRSMLQVGHEDARRFALDERRPAYLLDFELIHRYAFRLDGRPDWVSELQYLLCRDQTTLLIGPGTEIEIEKFIHSIGFVWGSDGQLEDRIPGGGRDRKMREAREDALTSGMQRLSRLLDLPNVVKYSELMEVEHVDQEAFEGAKAALDVRRKDRSEANWSDALNWAAVVHLRIHEPDLDVDFHPYLLTATRSLLDEVAWSRQIAAPVSRRPSDAVYTEVLLDSFPDPGEAAVHTVEMAWKASGLERDLRSMPAYLHPDDYRDDPEFQGALEEDRVSDGLGRQLQELADFVRDPVVTEAQRIYDNARLATVSADQQLGSIALARESPQKLFDLIVEVSAALRARGGERDLGDLWDTVLRLDTEADPGTGHVSFSLVDNSRSRARLYLGAEFYSAEAQGGELEEQFVFRWPTNLDAEAVMDAFSRAFSRHEESEVHLVVGTDHAIKHFGAELPISLADVVDAVRRVEEQSDRETRLGQVRWVRMGGDDFDLYADVSNSDVAQEPVVGVFVKDVNATHISDLYQRTSARYLLPAWLRRALETIKTKSK